MESVSIARRAGRLARRSSDSRASWRVATLGDFAARSLAIRRSVAPALVSARLEGFSSVSARWKSEQIRASTSGAGGVNWDYPLSAMNPPCV